MNEEDEVYRLAPRYLFECAIVDAGLAELGDHRVEVAWELFECRMVKHGYVHDKEEKE